METATGTATGTGTGTAPTEAASARRALARRGVLPVTVAGPSMRPTYRPEDIVFVCRAPAYRPGDVALIDAGGTLLLHRLIARLDGTRFAHAGDASPRWGIVSTRQLIGRVEGAPRRAPTLPARAATLALQTGALILKMGIPIPGRRP